MRGATQEYQHHAPSKPVQSNFRMWAWVMKRWALPGGRVGGVWEAGGQHPSTSRRVAEGLHASPPVAAASMSEEGRG